MTSRFTNGGDEHLLVECDEAMSFDAFFKSLTAGRMIAERAIPGVTEICAGNASYLVRYDPDVIHPKDLLREVVAIDAEADREPPRLDTRIVEVPVYYQDPWTHDTLMRFRERHQDPGATDLEYAARINGYDTVDAFIEAHHGAPWFVSMVAFVTGCPWLYQLVERERQIEVPKYLRPRTDSPRQAIVHGGCFAAIYAVRGAGGFQMFGITPMPIYDPHQAQRHMRDSIVFCRPGDIFKFKPIGREEYDATCAEVEAGRFEPRVRDVHFDLDEFRRDIDGYNARLKGVLDGN